MAVSLNVAAAPALAAIFEGATEPAGTTVSSLVVDGSITGVNGSLEAIAIERLNTSLGTWQYKLEGTSQWLTIRADLINSTTNTLALLLGPNDSISLLSYGDLNGTLADAITFRAWDMTSGTAGQYVVTTPGVGAFSTASDTAAITVEAVNDAPTFAPVQGTGKAIIPVGASSDQGYSVTVQPNGKILVAGSSFNGSNYDFSLIRLNANGELDTSFSTDGKAIIPVGASDDYGLSVTVQPDGKILVAGYSYNGFIADFSLIRLDANGELDTSFSTDGKAIIPVVSSDDLGQSVTVQPDGKILVAGYSGRGSSTDFCLIRLDANGELDTSFSADGKAIIPVGAFE